MDYAIGIDLGGTNIKAAAVTPSGEVLEQSSAETRDGGGDAWAGGVRGQIEALASHLGGAAICVGIASPGMAARDGRSMASVSGHLESIQRFHLVGYLGEGREGIIHN